MLLRRIVITQSLRSTGKMAAPLLAGKRNTGKLRPSFLRMGTQASSGQMARTLCCTSHVQRTLRQRPSQESPRRWQYLRSCPQICAFLPEEQGEAAKRLRQRVCSLRFPDRQGYLSDKHTSPNCEGSCSRPKSTAKI